MPRRGAGRYFFALNRRSPLSPADAGPPRALSATRARAETARTTPEGPGACDRVRLSAFAAPSLGFLERAFSVGPHATAPLRAPASPALDVRAYPRPLLDRPRAATRSRDEKVEGGHHARRARVRRPRRLPLRRHGSPRAPRAAGARPDPDGPPPLTRPFARRVERLRRRTRAEDERSLTRPRFAPPPFFTPQAYSYMRRRLKQLPWGGDCALFEYGKCQEN